MGGAADNADDVSECTEVPECVRCAGVTGEYVGGCVADEQGGAGSSCDTAAADSVCVIYGHDDGVYAL